MPVLGAPVRILPQNRFQGYCKGLPPIRMSYANQNVPVSQPFPAPPQIALGRILLGLTWIGRFDYI
jgi:hypothetical protein